MTYQLKVVIAYERPDILLATCEKIIESYHIVPLVEQPTTQMRTYKTSSTGHQYPLHTSFHFLVFKE